MPDSARDLSRATVAQILIPVQDLDRSIAYYRDTLGIPFLFTAPPQMSFFQCGNVRFLVGVAHGDSAQRGSAIYLKVDDIHAVHEELARRGVTFGAAPHLVHRAVTYDLWLSEFKDPDGNQLALMSEVPRGA